MANDYLASADLPAIPAVPAAVGDVNTRAALQRFGLLGAGGVAGLSGIDPQALNALAVLRALQDISEKKKRSVPFPIPGEALKASGTMQQEQYAPSGLIFTGGVPYKPNYGAQETAAAGMLISNILDSYQKNVRASRAAQAGGE